jgi:chemosensory pili system protein ChpA (sensor histidine kinase/response regulator)
MSTAQKLDYTTLKWVKSEIDENLKQTRQALETYVENPDDTTQIRFCTTYLHQIYGTLQMVEIYGAALLSEEMEKLALALLEGNVRQKDDAYDALMRAILQLPSYLEHLEHGEQDRPVILLPLLNDLRAARNETLLSENAFFSPNLSVTTPRDSTQNKKPVEIQSYAKKLRSVFQASLVGLYRNENTKGNLRKIGAVFKELLVQSESENARRLWWVSSGVIEALFDNGLEINNNIRQLISQIDAEIKKLINEGDQSYEQTPATELIKNLLFYIATAKSSGKRVVEIKKAFNLEQLIPSGDDISQAFDRLRGSSQDLMESVSNVVKEDLLQIKDQLDIFVRDNNHKAEQLSPFAEQLSRISDTLAMLGLGDLHKIIQDQTDNIRSIIISGEAPSESSLMEIASALLYI